MAIHRGLPKQKALLKQVASLGGSVSSRRPTRLTEEQIAALKAQDRQWQRLSRQLADRAFARQHDRIRLERMARLQRLKTRELARVRAAWSDEQGVRDVALHAQGIVPPQPDPPAQLQHPLQKKMTDAMQTPLVNDHDAIRERRKVAIQALITYCSQEEPQIRRIIKSAAELPPPTELSLGLAPAEAMEQIKQSVLTAHTPTEGIRRCYVCVAKAATLVGGHENNMFNEYCHEFVRPGTLSRHFIQKHLDAFDDDDTFICPICNVLLIHKKHLQNHSAKQHGVNTNIIFKRPVNGRNGRNRRNGRSEGEKR